MSQLCGLVACYCEYSFQRSTLDLLEKHCTVLPSIEINKLFDNGSSSELNELLLIQLQFQRLLCDTFMSTKMVITCQTGGLMHS